MASKSNEPTGWVGWVFFAGFMMIMGGFFNIVAGLTALFNDTWLVATSSNYLILDVTQWGWYHLIVGAIVLWAGFSVMTGAVWARTVGVVVALVSAVASLATIEVYPLWSVMILIVDVLVIFALTVHGDELKT